MRSRYSAYALGLVDYVIDTTAEKGPRARADRALWAREVAEFGGRTHFQGLEIRGSGEQGESGWVEFRAVLLEGAEDVSFSERSGFVKVNGRWLYASGTRVRDAR
jgi:SEC-C motif-containing protein